MSNLFQPRHRSRRTTFAMISAAASVAITSHGFAQPIPAFPGADGAAGTITGGRGGVVYHVTSLASAIDDPNANAFGTLKYGLTDANFVAGPRTIVFDVAGVFNLGRLPQASTTWNPNGNGWDTQSRINIPSNVTIAGQTAPGKVIIMGGTVKMSQANSIVRNVTVAPGYGTRGFYNPGTTGPTPGDFPDSYVYDAFDVSGQNLMIDHVSTVYATDETISCNELANNLTVQYSNISQGQNYPQADAEGGGAFTGHALGSLLQAGTNAKISVLHNLYAHQKGRLPRVGSEVGTGANNDFRNNVFYNWLSTAGSGASAQPSFNKFVGNYYLAGPGGDDPVGGTSTLTTNRSGGTGIFNGASTSATRIYHSGNFKDTNKNGTAEFTTALTNSDFSSSTFVTDASFSVPYFGVTDTAAVAYDRVLNYMGANWWTRDGVIDTVDERIVNEVRTGTGKIMAWADDPFNSDPNEGTEWRAMLNTPQTLRPGSWDTDQDGMPDYWENAHGLNRLAQDNNGDFDADGYTNLEEYLNEIAEWPAPKALIFTGATNTRYEQITNWDIPWEPSKYDEAQVNSGTVTIDSVGQHARDLKVATNAGNVATLAVSGGWIDVAHDLLLGPAGTGTIAQTGGTVIAEHALIVGKAGGGSSSMYLLQSGSLVTPNVQLRGGASMVLSPGGNKILSTGSLSVDVANGSKLDLNDNDALLIATPKAQVEALVAQGRAGGGWTGPGIASSSAAANPATGLGVLSGAEYLGLGNASFDGVAVQPTDVLVKYTWNGDANFDGRVTFDDYVRIDTGFNTGLTGWLNGDFNYSGGVSFDDYVLIDIAFNQQNGTLSRAIDWISGDDRSESGRTDFGELGSTELAEVNRAATGVAEVIAHFERFGSAYGAAFLAAVPEPTSLAVFAVPALGFVARRRRVG